MRDSSAHALDASDAGAISELARRERADVVVNACDPRLNPSIFAAAFDADCHYLDMAMTLSEPHPERPYEVPGVLLGAEQFAATSAGRNGDSSRWWAWAWNPASPTCSPGTRPITCSRRSTRSVYGTAATSSSTVSTSRRRSRSGPPSRSASTRPSCGNGSRGLFTTAPFSEPETFAFPAGIGPLECVNVEHEEVLLIPRHVVVPARHVQVRARRRVHRSVARVGQDGSRVDHAGARARCRRVAPRSRCRGSARPRVARRSHARAYVRRYVGDGHGRRR